MTPTSKRTVHRLDDVVAFGQVTQDVPEILLHLPASGTEFLGKPKPFQCPQPGGMQGTIV